MRLGVFGGTFNPPHNGHLILASEAFGQAKLDKVLWVLTPLSPFKLNQVLPSVEIRLKMLHAAIDNDSRFEISFMDINRPAPHYASDTLQLLRKVYADDELFYIMGADSLNDLPTWHAPRAFLAACDGLLVMHREQEEVVMGNLESSLPGVTPKIQLLASPVVDISSREIRERIVQERPVRYLLPDGVLSLIQEYGLYKE